MKRSVFYLLSLIHLLQAAGWAIAADEPIRNGFSKYTAAGNKLTVMGAGFGAYPQAALTFSQLPYVDTFEDSTDGFGAIVIASPGQGIMIAVEPIETSSPAVVRCTVRSDQAHASIAMACIDLGPNTFVSTNMPNNGAYFLDRYRRLSAFFAPPSTGFQPLIQIVNTSKTEILTVYLDNFDVYLLEPGMYYSSGFLDGDEEDPETISIDSLDYFTPTPTNTPLDTPILLTPTPTDTATPTITPTFTPTNTPTPTPTPSPTYPPIGELKVTNVSYTYSTPYLLDYKFSLQDENDMPVTDILARLKIDAFENGIPVQARPAGLHLTDYSGKLMKCYLVLDYTFNMGDTLTNGDSDGDGLSDPIEAMEQAAKNFADGLNPDALIGLYEYHRDRTSEPVTGFTLDRDYFKNQIDAVVNDKVQWYFEISRLWDTLDAAIGKFNDANSRDEQRFIVFLSNGNDESSTLLPTDIIRAAKAKQIKLYAIGFGANLDPADLQIAAEQTGGKYYTASSASEIGERFAQISEDLKGQYALRWSTLKRDTTSFLPSFTVTLGDHAGSYTANQTQGYKAADYTGEITVGALRFVSGEFANHKATIYLRADYVPRYIRTIRLFIDTQYPLTASLVPSTEGGLCGDWNLSITSDLDTAHGKWIEIQSGNPLDINSSIQYGGFGPILKLQFSGLTSLNDLKTCGWFIDNDVYAQTGGQSFRLLDFDSANPIPTCTPTSTATPTPTMTDTPTPSPTTTPTPSPTPDTSNTPTPIVEPDPAIIINLPNLPVDAIPFEMIWIQPGTFFMGSPESELDRKKDEWQHQIMLTQGFYMGKYEVTQGHWLAVTSSDPLASSEGQDYPIQKISWNDAQTFIQKLNAMGQGTFRLPTEAEWEYACRAGTRERFYWGDDPDYTLIGRFAWYDGNNDPYGIKTAGTKLPNPWGLYDMSGNVSEWCSDWYSEFINSIDVDPRGPEIGLKRVWRGGNWYYSASSCRSAYRNSFTPDSRFYYMGLRLVREFP